LKSDLQRFKQLTMGHTVIMGRKTWESIGRPLPERRMVVITRQRDYRAEGADVVGSIEEAFKKAKNAGDDEAFVIGGAEIYALALPVADRLYLTRVHAKIEGDTMLPPIDWIDWRQSTNESHDADDHNDVATSFQVFERQTPRSPG
jgi:dihydrofolate reductase